MNEQKIALVTGGMGAIGTAICQALHMYGTRVIAAYNKGGDHEQAQQWLAQQQNLQYEFDARYVEVTNFDSCGGLIRSIKKDYGRIDILVNNAGITRDTQLYKMDLTQWHEVLRTNLDSVFNMTRNVLPLMIEKNYGRIINISSINGQKGQFGQVNYSAAKAGVHGFTKALSQEVARKGITVNTISPGYIETRMVLEVAEQVREKIVEEIPVKRLGQPHEVARAVVFLSAEESSFITGSNLVVNGGQYLS